MFPVLIGAAAKALSSPKPATFLVSYCVTESSPVSGVPAAHRGISTTSRGGRLAGGCQPDHGTYLMPRMIGLFPPEVSRCGGGSCRCTSNPAQPAGACQWPGDLAIIGGELPSGSTTCCEVVPIRQR